LGKNNKEARIEPLYFQWSVKMDINNVNIAYYNPFISSGDKNGCPIPSNS
jgi:hypothetical protein